jgi:ParB/RepB/Spo0J family partition protein
MNPIKPISQIPSVQRFSVRQTVQEAMATTLVADTLRGRQITWELVQVPADKVELATMVWTGNERCQELLKPENLTHITATLGDHGNDEWAKGRRVLGIIEVADGSCRRAGCIQEGKPFNILVCNELTDEDMDYLTNIGNQYRQPSPWEKGRHYARLEKQLGSLRQVEEHLRAQGDRVSRRTISRCIKTAELPLEIIALLDSPSSLSPEVGAELAEKLGSVVADAELLQDLICSVPEQDDNADDDGDSQVITWLRAWNPPPVEAGSEPEHKPDAFKPNHQTITTNQGEIKVNGRRMAVQLTRSVNKEDCQWLAGMIQAAVADLAYPPPLRGRGMTDAMMSEYRDKLEMAAAEFSIDLDRLDAAVMAEVAERMDKDSKYNPYPLILNIRALKSFAKDMQGHN